ncbi:MAG: hypothetical protein R3D89_09935 [Sphingomonadaceae bacterium]
MAEQREMPENAEEQDGWGDIMRDLCALGNEASMVIPLRIARLFGGGEAAREEFQLMVSEKVEAHGDWLRALSSGELGRSCREVTGATLRHYLPWVRANRERLVELVE